jgi:LPS sulfotransferase NodH
VKSGRPVSEDQYDQSKLLELIRSHQWLDANWERTFAELGVQPYRITYEVLAADPSAEAAKIAEYLELPGKPIPNKKPPTMALQKQANTLNAIWEARLREERPDICETIPQT